MIQVIVMTSDREPKPLRGFMHLWEKYWSGPFVGVVCGFTKPEYMSSGWRFLKSGEQEDFPPQRWSERLLSVLDTAADDVFMLLLDDYWPIRMIDTVAVRMMYDYMLQFRNVIKFDLGADRLYADGGNKYLWGYGDYETLGYLDLIKSNHASAYHMSLWGGLWRRDLMEKIVIPGETAQQIEINGTGRLAQIGDEMLVLGTRQAPLRHINAIQGRNWNYHQTTGITALKPHDRKELEAIGYAL